MAIAKKRKAANTKVDKTKNYSLREASALVKEVNTTKFDASVDLHIRLGVDPKKADQAIRGTVNLPHGTGKTKRVLVLTTPDKEADAKAAGADFVGLDEFVTKIEGGGGSGVRGGRSSSRGSSSNTSNANEGSSNESNMPSSEMENGGGGNESGSNMG